jgi:sugar O-acyltransferase (sialic acid O-acetyltransferase NeuD family)
VGLADHKIAIIGWHEGAAGQIHTWLEDTGNFEISCFINPSDEPIEIDINKNQRDVSQFAYPTSTSFKDKPLINSTDWCTYLRNQEIRKVLITTPDQHQRYRQINAAREIGLELINAIHPTALVMTDAILADNIILHARAYVGYRTELSTGVVINTGAQLDHHNAIGECVTLDPACVTAGNVTVGRFSVLHTGATIINKIRIGENAIVGAGSVITQDVPYGATVVGVPGRVIKHHNSRVQ